MQAFRARRRATSWLMLVAMVLAALAPALSHALALGSGEPAWVEICTSEGSRWVKPGAAQESVPAQPADAVAAHSDHCLFCQAGTQGMAPPPTQAGLPTLLGVR
ncbi:MAG: DUF2946 family protein, partial [Rubrivivax sp.]|nr:DUF2946 family protein [Rubrivivax sp.]